jgi:hypothetical protein
MGTKCEWRTLRHSHSIDEMKTRHSSFAALLLVLLFTFSVVQPVLAHGGDPRLEISSESLSPGASLDIRGVDFEFEEQVVLTLIGPQVELPLGTVIADAEGIFFLTLALPHDLTEGAYVIRATTDDHILDSPEIKVWGSANLGGGEEGQREEADGLLIAIPTAAPDVPTPMLSSNVSTEPAAVTETLVEQRSSIPYVWIAAGVVAVLVLGLLLRSRK